MTNGSKLITCITLWIFLEHLVRLHACHYPQPTWPILSSAMPRHELILHIALAVCSRPSGSGCKVLLKCNLFKTVILKVSLILTSLTPCLHIYETEDEVYVSQNCCCYGHHAEALRESANADLRYLSGNNSIPCSTGISYKHIMIHM